MSPPRGYGPAARDSSQIPEPYIFYQFYSASDDPWFPAGVIQPALTQPRSSTATYNNGSRGFHNFRSPALPSDCDTAPEDSGYGSSRPTYSINESVASVNENDRCTETGFLGSQTAEQLIGIGGLDITSAAPIYKATNVKSHHCDQCGADVKTKSELKKHNHRHNKPYKCTYETCPKATQGFSTPNDLSRHKRTVHREHNSYGAVYICRYEPCIHKKEKLWPRADNFRSHLIRAHNIHLKADDDLRIYRHQPGTSRLHERRDGRSSAAGTRPRPRPTQTRHSSPYTCRHDDCSRGKEDTWPTADDLLIHLAHVHGIYLKSPDDIKYYSYQTEATEPHALRGVGSSVADVDPEPRPAQVQDSPDLRSDQVPTTALSQAQNEPSKQSSLPLTPPCLLSGDESPLMRSNILHDFKSTAAPGPQPIASDVVVEMASVGEISLADSEIVLPGDEPTQENFDQDEGDLMGGEEEMLDRQDPLTLTQVVSPDSPIPESNTDAPQRDMSESRKKDNDPDNVSGASTNALVNSLAVSSPDTAELLTLARRVLLDGKDGPSSDILSFLRDLPKDLLEKALKSEDPTRSGSDTSSDQSERQKAPPQCPECPKSFSRMCELRKHMKRHEKPYGCTYKTCHKMFGSKNDWKRHESSQHFQMESWNCDYTGCDKVLPRRELFKTHLQNDHKLLSSHKIENKLESCRLGRHCDPRFWCGFCIRFIEIREKVVNSWTKRCDHIDNHLFGKEGVEKKNMGDWCYLEDKLAEGDPEPSEKLKAAEASSGSAKKRKATEELDTRPAKRHSFIWFCCLCKHPENYRTSSRCMEGDCCHQRCKDCVVERIPDLDHESEPAGQEEER